MAQSVETLVWELRRLFHALAAVADRELVPLGITAGDRALLEFLAREQAPISLAALARKRRVSRQHIHQSLARLPNQAWIAKRPDPDDARSVLLQLTRQGRLFWKQIRVVDRAVLARIGRGVNPWKVRAATATLREIRALLEG